MASYNARGHDAYFFEYPLLYACLSHIHSCEQFSPSHLMDTFGAPMQGCIKHIFKTAAKHDRIESTFPRLEFLQIHTTLYHVHASNCYCATWIRMQLFYIWDYRLLGKAQGKFQFQVYSKF